MIGKGKHTAYENEDNWDNWYVEASRCDCLILRFFPSLRLLGFQAMFPCEVSHPEVGNGSRSTQRSHPGETRSVRLHRWPRN